MIRMRRCAGDYVKGMTLNWPITIALCEWDDTNLLFCMSVCIVCLSIFSMYVIASKREVFTQIADSVVPRLPAVGVL